MTKAAQIHLVKVLAMISASIRVNSVSPGILLTVGPPKNVRNCGCILMSVVCRTGDVNSPTRS